MVAEMTRTDWTQGVVQHVSRREPRQSSYTAETWNSQAREMSEWTSDHGFNTSVIMFVQSRRLGSDFVDAALCGAVSLP